MKRLFATMITLAVMTTCFTGCGADKATDNTVSTSKTESAVDMETTEQVESVTEEKEKAPAGKLEDCPKLTIELKDGKTFTYNGENFTTVYQQLTELGIAKEKTEGYYEDSGNFISDWIEVDNGTKFTIFYAQNNQVLTVATGEGVKNKVAWNITVGNINNAMTISDLVDMGAEALREESNAHGDRTTDYLLTSENYETKGVSIKASGDGTPQLEDLVVEGLEIKYSGVEN